MICYHAPPTGSCCLLDPVVRREGLGTFNVSCVCREFTRSFMVTDPDEFWIALMEKAYAKMVGTYEALEFGSPTSALVDLSGAASVSGPCLSPLGNQV